MQFTQTMKDVSNDVMAERFSQNKKWGLQRHPHGEWLMILTEEVGEVAQAMQSEKGWGKDSDSSNLYEELIHVAAVAQAIAEHVMEDRKKKDSET